MTQPTFLVDCYNCEQLLTKICAECEHAQKMKQLSEDPMASTIWSRWIHGELQAPH
jgi:hypothetical protein